MLKPSISLFVTALFVSPLQAQTTDSLPVAIQKTARSVQPKNIEAHMRYLSDDKLNGRKPGTEGYEMAARYVEQQLKSFGFKPAGEKGTYRQAVPLRRGQVREESSRRKSLCGLIQIYERVAPRGRV